MSRDTRLIKGGVQWKHNEPSIPLDEPKGLNKVATSTM